MNILIPTDFSENSFHAIRYVYEHFDKDNVAVTLLHSVPLPTSPTFSTLVTPDYDSEERAQEAMRQQLDEIKKLFNSTPKSFVTNGYLGDMANTFVKHEFIDLIVMGTKGESNIESKIFGSNTEIVIRDVTVPVLAIPFEVKKSGTCRIVFARKDYDLPKKEFIQSFIKHHSHGLKHATILNVKKGDSEPVPKCVPFGGNTINIEVVEDASVINGINQYLDTHRVDILCLFHRHRSFFGKFFNPSLSNRLCAKSPVPLLIIPDK